MEKEVMGVAAAAFTIAVGAIFPALAIGKIGAAGLEAIAIYALIVAFMIK